MEKQRVNDAVVKLANLILKARVHVAHRLSSKIRALRVKKDEKASKRIERLILEIAFLKTLSKSGARKAAARQMLLNTENLAAKIERESTSPEDRAFCRLCKTKFIESSISQFREENVDWKYWVPPLLAMWDKKVEMKKTRISKPDPDEPQRLSAREIAEARKRKAEFGNSEDNQNGGKRAKRNEAPSDRRARNKEKKTKSVSNRFIIEPMQTSKDSKGVSSADDSGDFKARGKVETAEEESDDDDRGDNEPRLDSEKRAVSVTSEEASPSRADVDQEEESPSSSTVCQVPFRPYAPKYPVSSSESEKSTSEEIDDASDSDSRNAHEELAEEESSKNEEGSSTGGDENDSDAEESDEEDEDQESRGDSVDEESSEDGHENPSEEQVTPLGKKPVSSALSVSEWKKILANGSENSDQDEEGSSEGRDEDHSDENDDSDREREFEERIEKKFKSNGAQGTMKIPVSSYEPDSSEERFPTQEDPNDHRGNECDSDEERDDDRASSFFLRKGEQPEDVQSRTIPKEKAPGLNRRQRRGHGKQRSFNDPAQDGSDDAEPRSNMTFGKDFRPRKSFQHQDRQPGSERRKPFDHNSSGARDVPASERFNRNGQHRLGKNPRASLPGRFENFPSQDRRRDFVNFSKNASSDPRTNRDERRPSRGRFEQKDKRFSERSERQAGGPMKRDRWQQHYSSSSAAPQGNGTQDKTRPGTAEKLHPSWMAKKKLNEALNKPFEGKKIVFDD